MKTLEKEILRSIKQIAKKLADWSKLHAETPTKELLAIHYDLSDLLNEYKGGDRLKAEFLEKVSLLKDRQDRADKVLNKQRKLHSPALTRERVKLRMELSDLISQCYFKKISIPQNEDLDYLDIRYK